MKRSRILGALPLCCGLLLMGAQDNACTILLNSVDDQTQDDGNTTQTGQSCQSDADCADDQFCAFLGAPPEVSDASGARPQAPDDSTALPEGSCQPIPRDPCATVRCSADTHCEGTPDGAAACVPNDPGCFSDDECGGRGFCDFSTCAATPDSNGNDPAVTCQGTCRPYENTCANVRCTAETHCVEMSGGPQCVPNDAAGCFSDDECGGRGFCDFSDCPADSFAACQGTCRPYENTCANVRCNADTHCIESPRGPQCVPNDPPPAMCTTNDECASGQACNADTLCLPDPNCVAGDNCPDVCWGYCENTPTSCETTGCRDGEICANIAYCDPDLDVYCRAQMQCIPQIRPCVDNTQCLSNEFCSLDDPPPPPPPPPCPEGTVCRPALAPQGTCQPL